MNNSINFLDIIFPKFCLGCQKEGAYLCEDCRGLLDICEFDYCLCDKPAKLLFDSKTGKCNRCQEKNLDGLYFALPYKDGQLVKKLVRQFKYEPYLKNLAETLASILIEHFIKTKKNTNQIWAPSGVPAVLIPVPLHVKKIRERGYNQSEELAKELSKVLQIPVLSNYIIKTKSTSPQMQLSRADREKNLQNAFSIQPPSLRGATATKQSLDLSNKKIFLVDDVYTTGFTMQECAGVLKNAGAKSVWGITLAREG